MNVLSHLLTLDTWQHVTASYQKSTGKLRIHINGALLEDGTVTANLDLKTSGSFYFNRRPFNNVFGLKDFQGGMDEVMLFNRALTSAEVTSLAANSICPTIGQNTAPAVVTESEIQIIQSVVPAVVQLEAIVADDGLPSGSSLTSTWTQSGSDPLTATISSPASLITDVSLPDFGTYHFTVDVSDGDLTTSRPVTILFDQPANAPPVAQAGSDQRVAVFSPLQLSATASDDALPVGSSLSYQWSVVQGLPSKVGFSDDTVLQPTVTLEQPGDFILRLEVSDGTATSTSEVTLTSYSPASITLESPLDGQNVTAGSPLPVKVDAFDSFFEVQQVEILLDGSPLGFAVPDPNDGVAGNDGLWDFQIPATFLTSGNHLLTATASTTQGEINSASATITVAVDPGVDPVADILTPGDSAIVTAPTAVIGTASSPVLKNYEIEYRLQDPQNESEENWVLFAEGNTSVTEGELGVFDPTLLLNGIYDIRLTVFDQFGRGREITKTVIVDGKLKVGHFSLAFEDLVVPMAGVPIRITRSYDSRDHRKGDFGTGWHVSVNNVRLQKTGSLGQGWVQKQLPSPIPAFQYMYCLEPKVARLVSITFPDGEQHLFEMSIDTNDGRVDIDANCQVLSPVSVATVVFTPKGDTTGSLEPVGGSIVYTNGSVGALGDTELYVDDPILLPEIYNPTRFILTKKDGAHYLIDQFEGLISMEDLNGNTLEVFENKIVSTMKDPNGGADIVREVAFLRDGEGRITDITDPDGNALSYGYEPEFEGLRNFTNRVNEATQFVYGDSRFPNYLTEIIDPRGVRAIRTEYNDDGTISRQIDADNKATVFVHDLDAFTETVTDRLGNVTTFYYDDFGNVVRQVDPIEAETTFEYYPGTELVKYETDDLGNVISRAYDSGENLLVEITGASIGEDPLTATTGFVTRYSYNEFSLPTSITDPNGNLTEFTYDAHSRQPLA